LHGEDGGMDDEEDLQARTWTGGVDDEQMYTRGPARIIQLPGASKEERVLALRFSYELSQKLKLQIGAGRKLRATREALAQRRNEIKAEIDRLRAEHARSKEELDAYLAPFGDDELTPEQASKASVLATRGNDIVNKHEALKSEREKLPQYFDKIESTWLGLVEEVEAIQEDVFLKCKLITETEGPEQLPWNDTQSDEEDSTASDPPLPPREAPVTSMNQHDETTRKVLSLRNRLTQRALVLARELHDGYRIGYKTKFREYVAKQVNRPNTDFREEFSQKWLEGWHEVIKALDETENAARDAIDKARAANVTIEDNVDQGEPNIPYDIEWWDHEMMKQLDRSQIELWYTDVVAGARGPERPAGNDEAELEEQTKAEQLEPTAAKGLTGISDIVPTMSQNEPSDVRENTTNPSALHVPLSVYPPLRSIKQMLAEVKEALSRACELISSHINESGILKTPAETGDALEAIEQAPLARDDVFVSKACAAAGTGNRQLEKKNKVPPALPVSSKRLLQQGDNPERTAKMPEATEQRKGRAYDDSVIEKEPGEEEDSAGMDRRWKKDLAEYMRKYKIAPPPISKKRNQDNVLSNRDVLISHSERAYGNKRRRIDEWGNEIRSGDC
jgi:hypothetical protein